jgi:hypothetical protein
MTAPPQPRNELLGNGVLPADVVFHPAWWHAHAGITFDEDFFYHPARRVESERKMEQVLHERFGAYGLGTEHDRDLPVVGAIHNAAGYFLSELLGCEVRYRADAAPEVVPARRERLEVDADAAFRSPAFQRYERLRDALKARFGYVLGDINWAGVLNLALDLRGQDLFLDLHDAPDATAAALQRIGEVAERFASSIQAETGTSSISVNRTVRHFARPVFLHSECAHTMISAADYERFILPIDAAWSRRHRPFGLHHCGRDAHRFAASYARLPQLDFLDVGWGSDVRDVREKLPQTFLNLRLDPVQFVTWSPEQIRQTILRLAADAANPWLTGVCCINLDQRATDAQISALFETVAELRRAAPGG